MATYSRRERRTRGKWIAQRLQVLKNSQILKDADLSDLPEDVVKSLQGGKHENVALQKRYNTAMKIMDELIRLQMELRAMQEDLKVKRGLQAAPQEHVSNVQ